MVAPRGRPTTKPRALNVALGVARGSLLVVYDAEDRPAKDQIRLAAERFAADPTLDCLQARLAIDNGGDSWLAKMFAVEYATLFDSCSVTPALPLPRWQGNRISGSAEEGSEESVVSIGLFHFAAQGEFGRLGVKRVESHVFENG